jgi:hypothetical protein
VYIWIENYLAFSVQHLIPEVYTHTHIYILNWHLNIVSDVTKYSVFTAFFKLESPSENSLIENQPIYLCMKFRNNESWYVH